ncbi:MAG: hypothetical protein Ct9H300mP8_04910 [Gammaproteobacteria bacterium]|nr:MAG: hypothetical protein Ct9H300mP8_04910 [Gammaproteobacteria bacterium]
MQYEGGKQLYEESGPMVNLGLVFPLRQLCRRVF